MPVTVHPKRDSMRTLVVFDSKYGNTETIAKAIAGSISGDVKVLRASEASGALSGTDLLIAGAPTNGGRPTPAMVEFLDKIPTTGLQGVKVAAFDTRLTSRFAAIFGYAAGKIAASMEAKGGVQVVPPEGFLVKKTKGPLAEGEVERASGWGKSIADKSEAPAK